MVAEIHDEEWPGDHYEAIFDGTMYLKGVKIHFFG